MRRIPHLLLAAATLLASASVQAEDVRLPAPVLQWSFYIFLLFAAAVAIGIFFIRTRPGLVNEPLGTLIEKPVRSPVHAVDKNTPVSDCVKLMVEQQIGAVLVMDGNRLAGIFSERDCLQRVLGAGADPARTLVRDVMTEDPYCVTPSTSLSEAMAIVTNYRVRHLPVLDNGEVLGVISSGDLLLRLAAGTESELRSRAEGSVTRPQ